MRHWLLAKAEEDKRKQEEERTQQEALRLEQRKIEHDILKTSLSEGIPPYMIPMIFAGMGSKNLPNASVEWALAEAHHLQPAHHGPPPQAPSSPEPSQQRDSRVAAQGLNLASATVGSSSSQQQQQTAGTQPIYQMSPATRARSSAPGPAAVARPAPTSQLPRLNTSEMPYPPGRPLQHTPCAPEPRSSPSINFLHWQPPAPPATTTSQPSRPLSPSGKLQ